jgi:hypothetical protein
MALRVTQLSSSLSSCPCHFRGRCYMVSDRLSVLGGGLKVAPIRTCHDTLDPGAQWCPWHWQGPTGSHPRLGDHISYALRSASLPSTCVIPLMRVSAARWPCGAGMAPVTVLYCSSLFADGPPNGTLLRVVWTFLLRENTSRCEAGASMHQPCRGNLKKCDRNKGLQHK